ncbi:hypothetical protein SK128_014147, partial [Halocaridina rubra]
MTGRIPGRKGRGRPRKKFLDVLKEAIGGNWTDAQIRRRMKDREAWRSMVAHVRADTALRNKMMFWKEVKRVKKGGCGKEERVKGADGKLLVDEIKVREKWAEYFKNLLNEEDDREAEIMAVENEWRMPMLGNENDRGVTKEE